MRVLLVNAVCGSGSTGRICTDIADALMENGHEARILYGNGMSAYPNAVRVGSDCSVRLNALYALVSGYTAHGAILETKRIIQEILTFRPDVVHLHNLHANYAHLNQLLAFLAEKDIPTVITLHDC